MADNGGWYLTLGDFEHAEEDSDCTQFGPFCSQQAAEKYLNNFSNPGGAYIDKSGSLAPPANPNKPSYNHPKNSPRKPLTFI